MTNLDQVTRNLDELKRHLAGDTVPGMILYNLMDTY